MSITIPIAQDVRDSLEGYNITSSIISDKFIEDARDFQVIPWWNDVTRQNIETEETITEYHDGGKELIILNRRPINSLVSVEHVGGIETENQLSITTIEVLSDTGILKARTGLEVPLFRRKFPFGIKNMKIKYKSGGILKSDVKIAITNLTAILVLDNVEGRTGGGDLSVKSFSRSYGDRGKYTNIRNALSRHAMATMRRYATYVVGD